MEVQHFYRRSYDVTLLESQNSDQGLCLLQQHLYIIFLQDKYVCYRHSCYDIFVKQSAICDFTISVTDSFAFCINNTEPISE